MKEESRIQNSNSDQEKSTTNDDSLDPSHGDDNDKNNDNMISELAVDLPPTNTLCYSHDPAGTSKSTATSTITTTAVNTIIPVLIPPASSVYTKCNSTTPIVVNNNTNSNDAASNLLYKAPCSSSSSCLNANTTNTTNTANTTHYTYLLYYYYYYYYYLELLPTTILDYNTTTTKGMWIWTQRGAREPEREREEQASF